MKNPEWKEIITGATHVDMRMSGKGMKTVSTVNKLFKYIFGIGYHKVLYVK